MSKNKPSQSSDNPLSVPLVTFSPSAGAGEGSRMEFDTSERQYPIFLPLLIVLLTLIGTTIKDTYVLRAHNSQVWDDKQRMQNNAANLLSQTGQETDLVDSIHQDLVKLAPTEPAAGQILTDFFPAPPVPAKPTPSPSGSTPATGK